MKVIFHHISISFPHSQEGHTKEEVGILVVILGFCGIFLYIV